MKIIKRDGRVVEYDKSKIEKAIGKANAEVRPLQRVNKEQIADIIAYIEGLGKNKMQVEDVQDIIEKKLVELGKFELAKKYIIYRYTRALIRKANTTDESILGLIKNSNKDVMEENSNKNAVATLLRARCPKTSQKEFCCPKKSPKRTRTACCIFTTPTIFCNRFSTAALSI